MPNVGKAQVFQQPTPPPQVTAANAPWRMNGEPIFYAGDFYYPSGPTVFFDGQVMVRSDVYRGVPVYADVTLEPWSVVFVPIGRNVMRPYERRRPGPGGVRTPPEVSVEPPVTAEAQQPALSRVEGPSRVEGAVGTVGTVVTRPPAAPVERLRPTRTVIETIPARPRTNAGIWIEYSGERWYNAGSAVPFSPDRFTEIGEYRGFQVYRDTRGKPDHIFVPAVQGGPLVPYAKR